MSQAGATTSHRYPGRALAGDYARAAIGIVFGFGPLAFSEAAPVMVYILVAIGTLFLVFGVRTVLRHMTRVEVSADGIRLQGPAGTAIRWWDLEAMTLRYYSTQRDRKGGWMQLELTGAGRTLKLVSSIEDFPVIVHHAAGAARVNGVALDESTRANLDALEISVDESVANA